jgi:hypothetical protein
MPIVGRTLLAVLAAALPGCGPDGSRDLTALTDPVVPPPPPGVVPIPTTTPSRGLTPAPPSPTPPAPAGVGGSGGYPPAMMPPPAPPVTGPGDAVLAPLRMSFFVSSRGSVRGGGDFRERSADPDGLAGADALCKTLAGEVLPELGRKTWRAYLSTETVDARDRIGEGPWRNAVGIVIAEDLEQLHEEREQSNNLLVGDFVNAFDEKGNPVTADRHDILTGTAPDGRRDPQNRTCGNWRSASPLAQALVGHADRKGTGTGNGVRSWNGSHAVGCGPVPSNGTGNRTPGTVTADGGRGSIYCFATD